MSETQEFDFSVGVMVATGTTDEEIAKARDACKAQIGFYGSTPAYKIVLEQHGWESIQPELNSLTKKGLWQDIPVNPILFLKTSCSQNFEKVAIS